MLRALLCVLVAAPVLAGELPLTIERIFADPPLEGVAPKEVKWLPDGARLSFIDSSGRGEGARSTLVVEDARSGARETMLVEAELTSFGEGAAAVRPHLAGYQWSKRGDALLLSGDGELFLVELPGKRVRRLTSTPGEEEQPQLSPDGAWVAYVRDNDLYALRLADLAELRLSNDGSPDHFNGKLDWVYQEELAGPATTGFVWSPDSRAIAFLTLDETAVPTFPLQDLLPVHPTTTLQHYPKAGDPNPTPGLVVVELEARSAGGNLRVERRWSGEGAPYVVRFGFTPAGRALWYELLNRAQTRLELLVEECGGAPRTLLVDEDAAWINLHDDLYFLRDGRFVWSSERSGARHLELHDAEGKLLRQLTGGAWEVERLDAVDEAAGWLYFTASEKSPLERHLYRVRLNGAGFTRLTSEAGTHEARLAPGGRLVLDTYKTLVIPKSIRVLDAGGTLVRRLTTGEEGELSSYALARAELISLPTPTGVTLYGSLIKPRDFDPARRYPVVIYVYGGPHDQTVRDTWGAHYELFHSYLASRGFIVFSLDNRGSTARGRDFERVLLHRLGKVELEDQLTGVAYLRSLPFVDGDRIGIWGKSYGGYMTCYALTNAPEVFRAGVAIAPVTDWRLYDSIYTERYLKSPEDNPDGYRDSSPVNQVERLQGALLLAHGTGDDNVHWQNTLAFVDSLYKAGKPYDLQLYPNKDHHIFGKDVRVHLYTRIAEHFERYLKR